jgi:hypothetical protein
METNEEQLEALVSRCINLDGRAGELSKDVTLLKKLIDGHQSAIERFDGLFSNDNLRIERLEAHQQSLSRSMSELTELLEQQARSIELLADRLNGKNIIQGEQYEKVVSQVQRIAESLHGGEGQLSYPQVRNSIQDTHFLGEVIKGFIGVFGIGVVGTIGSIIFGTDKLDPAFIAIEQKIEVVAKDVARLDNAWTADIQRRLDDANRE